MPKLAPLRLLRANRLIRSNRLKFLAVLAAELAGLRYTVVRLDPAAACNLRCTMCYFSNPDWVDGNTGRRLNAEELRAVADAFFPEALLVYIGCGFEPTVYKGYPEIVRLAKERGVRFVSLVTNGQLLTEEAVSQLIGYGLDEIVVSAHGVRPDTYHRFMPRASHEKLHRNLDMLTRLRRASGRETPVLRINYTVNRENLEELPELLEAFAAYDLRCLQVRPITNQDGAVFAGYELDGCLDTYRRVMAQVAMQCAEAGVTLMSNMEDPTIRQANPHAVVYENAVLRTISPNLVWRDGLHRAEDYRAFKRSIGFRRRLLGWALDGGSGLARPTALAGSSVN